MKKWLPIRPPVVGDDIVNLCWGGGGKAVKLVVLALGSPLAHDTLPVAVREHIYRRQQVSGDPKGTRENSSFIIISSLMQAYDFDRTAGGGVSS
jgi:hypothetical protein